MTITVDEGEALVREAFKRADITIAAIQTRVYPEEAVFVVHVEEEDFSAAARTGNDLDAELAGRGLTAFVTVR